MTVLGIIPARGGSKRVKDKNIRPLGGLPLIAHTINAAGASTLLSETLVSTDSVRIQNVCNKYGGNAPFLRPKELALDQTPDKPVLRHAIHWYENSTGTSVEIVVLLRPTTPFKTGELIDHAIKLLIESGADSVRSMTKVEGINHPYWMFQKSQPGDKAVPVIEGKSMTEYYQSQLLPPIYQLNGVIDVMRRDIVMNDSDSLYGDDIRILEVDPELSYDIDTELDFQYCEFLFSQRRIN